MLLRRFTHHLEEQNWLAVGLDFAIVVFGVIAGLQVSNWNDDREDRHAYSLARDRLIAEIDENLETLETLDGELNTRLSAVSEGFEALLTCVDNQPNRDLVSRALNGISGTTGLTLRTSAINEITSAQHLLAQQSPQERKAFNDLQYVMEFMQREARFMEELPLRERAGDNSLIKIAAPIINERVYNGYTWSTRRRPFMIGVSIEQACANDELVKAMHYWERWQSELVSVSVILKQQLTEARANLI